MFKNAYCFEEINKYAYLSKVKSNKDTLEIPEYNKKIIKQINDLNEEHDKFIKKLLKNNIL